MSDIECEKCEVNKYCGTCISCEQAREMYEKGRADAIDEYLRLFCNKDNQMNFVKLNHHSWTSYAKHIAEELKEQKND